MVKYDPDKHHRHSIRLKDYDYSQSGAYFLTICTQNREYFFGGVEDGKMNLNEAGLMVGKWWHELGNKFPSVEPADFVVMPNHFHGIINIAGVNPVGADLRVGPASAAGQAPTGQAPTGQTPTGQTPTGQTPRSAPTLGEIVQWFKTMTTNEYIRGSNSEAGHHFPVDCGNAIIMNTSSVTSRFTAPYPGILLKIRNDGL